MSDFVLSPRIVMQKINAPSVTINAAQSWVPLQLKLLAKGKELGVATGFFYVHKEREFLVTNYHVVSGINPNTGEYLDNDGAFPDTVTLKVASTKEGPAGEKLL